MGVATHNLGSQASSRMMQPSLKRGLPGMAGISEVAVGWQQRTEGVEKEKKEQQEGKRFWEARFAGEGG